MREAAGVMDAVIVLAEFVPTFAVRNRELDGEARAVALACWRILSDALEQSRADDIDFGELGELPTIPNRLGVLTRPISMVFEDRPDLDEMFGSLLLDYLVPRISGALKGMEAAGVRGLEMTLTARLLECRDPQEDAPTIALIKDRRAQLVRVLESETTSSTTRINRELLDSIRCQRAESLRRQRMLRLPGVRDFLGAHETVPAHIDRHDSVLSYVLRDAATPWAAIARELASALCPGVEPGRLAAGLKEVLAAPSAEAANDSLDELGFPVVESRGSTQASTEESVDQLLIAPVLSPPTLTAPPEQQPPVTEIVPPVTPSPPPAEPHKDPAGTSSPPGVPARRDTARRQGRLRTYVVPATSEAPERGPDGQGEDRTDVDMAGISGALAFERSRRRLPTLLPHHHPGYDIESRSADGAIERYIEVKSSSGLWGSLGVGLSKPQFDKAAELGDRYWVYVIENAASDDFRIYRINDPARQVDQFLYDDGWRAVAEPDPPES